MEELVMFLKDKPRSYKVILVLFLVGLLMSLRALYVIGTEQQEEPEIFQPIQIHKPEHVRGVHLTAWVAGSSKSRARVFELLDETNINTIVIGVKEYQGEVYVPGVPMAEKAGSFVNAMPELQKFLGELKKRGIYPIARIVVFKDKHMSLKRPELAIKRPDGKVWTDRAGNSWLDPYNKEVWNYTLNIASRCVQLGFEEIQFDYIRYPSDGDIKQCRYSYVHHNSSSAANNLGAFLQEANRRLKPMGANLSIDIFGLIPSVGNDMGIGQNLEIMTRWVDFVSPMVYPSHYAKGEYGIPNPNLEPYNVVHRTMSDAKKRLGENYTKIRPYLQDFSLGAHYGPEQVTAQIKACADVGIFDWLLWNPNSKFTKSALKRENGVQ